MIKYNENFKPIETSDYKGYHIRFYNVGGSIDTSIFNNFGERLLDLCDYKTTREALEMAKHHIDDLENEDEDYKTGPRELIN